MLVNLDCFETSKFATVSPPFPCKFVLFISQLTHLWQWGFITIYIYIFFLVSTFVIQKLFCSLFGVIYNGGLTIDHVAPLVYSYQT